MGIVSGIDIRSRLLDCPRMRYVCLFDIDGTLLATGGAGQRAMDLALAEVFGKSESSHGISAAGRTDRAITTELFACFGIESTPESWQRFVSAYLERLPRTLAELSGQLLPGVAELLTALNARGDVALGLLTGNFQEGARCKLEHFGLAGHFRFGGYGDEHPDRDDVARVAYGEAARHLGRDVEPERVWVIGDTPFDVRCGRAIGAKTLAVATGIFSYDELAAARPDILVRDLSATAELVIRMTGA